MHIPRRRFLRASLAALLTSGGAIALARAEEHSPSHSAYLPQIAVPLPTPTPTATPTSIPTATPTVVPTVTATVTLPPIEPAPIRDDAPIVGLATGDEELARAWFRPRADPSYTDDDVAAIVAAYRRYGELGEVDWFLALAQMGHETGHLTSFWSQRPQRNPAGIGVTGEWRSDPPPDPAGWAYNTQRGRWERGLSFATWAEDAVPAHLGRLLAYALADWQASDAQRELIRRALAYRPLPADRRGIAPRWIDLNGKWAVPGTTYGQSIIGLARRMRYGPASVDPSVAIIPGDEDADVMPADG